ncbi:unnamed protein product, partial [Ceratitis capitata]
KAAEKTPTLKTKEKQAADEGENEKSRNAYFVVGSSNLKENGNTPSPTKQKTTAIKQQRNFNTEEERKAGSRWRRNKKASKVQTVINRCITVKRKSSPLKNTSNTKRANTSNASQEASNSLDRFAALSEEEPMGKTSTE